MVATTATRPVRRESTRGGLSGWIGRASGCRDRARLAQASGAAARAPTTTTAASPWRARAAPIARWILVPARRAAGDGGASSSAAALAAWGMAALGRERPQRRGGGCRRGGDAVDRLGAARRAAGEPAASLWWPRRRLVPHRRPARYSRRPLGRGARRRHRAPHCGVGARRAPGRLVAGAVPQGRRGSRAASFTRRRSTSCSTTAPTSRFGIEVAGGMLLDGVPARGARAVPQHDPARDRAPVPDAAAARQPRKSGRRDASLMPGDAIEVVGRLSRRLDPTARAQTGRIARSAAPCDRGRACRSRSRSCRARMPRSDACVGSRPRNLPRCLPASRHCDDSEADSGFRF